MIQTCSKIICTGLVLFSLQSSHNIITTERVHIHYFFFFVAYQFVEYTVLSSKQTFCLQSGYICVGVTIRKTFSSCNNFKELKRMFDN